MTQFRNPASMDIQNLLELPSTGTNLSLKCRLAVVLPKNSKGTLFNVVIADRRGLADMTVYDVSKYESFKKLEYKCVSIKGLSCKAKDAKFITYGKSRNPNFLSAGDKTVINECEDDAAIPGGHDDNCVPDEWLMDEACKVELLNKITTSQSPSVRSTSNMNQVGKPCCSAPHGEICKNTGNEHELTHVVCAVCRTEIMPGEDYCAASSRKGKGCVLPTKRSREDGDAT